MLRPEGLDLCLKRGGQRVISSPHVGELCVAPDWRDLVSEQERVGGAVRIEGGIGMPQRVALVVNAAALVDQDVAARIEVAGVEQLGLVEACEPFAK
jgi:hypothetical protein